MVSYKVPKSAGYSKKIDTQIQKQEFISGLMNYGRPINVYGFTNNVASVLYSVPAGKTFFLLCSYVNLRATGGATTNAGYIYSEADNSTILNLASNNVASSSLSETLTYSIPLRFNSGNRFLIQTGNAGLYILAQISGYEVDSALLPNFI